MYSGFIFSACLFLISIFPQENSAFTEEQSAVLHEYITATGYECFENFKISEEDLNILKSHEVPNGNNANCFIACVFKKLALMDDEGIFQTDSVVEKARKFFTDEAILNEIGAILNACAYVNDTPVTDGNMGCDRALLAYKCLTGHGGKVRNSEMLPSDIFVRIKTINNV